MKVHVWALYSRQVVWRWCVEFCTRPSCNRKRANLRALPRNLARDQWPPFAHIQWTHCLVYCSMSDRGHIALPLVCCTCVYVVYILLWYIMCGTGTSYHFLPVHPPPPHVTTGLVTALSVWTSGRLAAACSSWSLADDRGDISVWMWTSRTLGSLRGKRNQWRRYTVTWYVDMYM